MQNLNVPGRGLLSLILAAGVLLTFATTTRAAQDFKAEYAFTKGKKTTTGVIRVQQSKYRLDIKKGKKRIRVIVDPAANLTVVADMRKKKFCVVKSPDDKDAHYDPFAAARFELMRYVPQTGDQEKMLGYQTEKTEYLQNGETRMSVWRAPRLGFPMKIVSGNTVTPRYVLHLKEIEEREFKTDIFELPAGFKPKPEKTSSAQKKRPGKKKSTGAKSKNKKQPE